MKKIYVPMLIASSLLFLGIPAFMSYIKKIQQRTFEISLFHTIILIVLFLFFGILIACLPFYLAQYKNHNGIKITTGGLALLFALIICYTVFYRSGFLSGLVAWILVNNAVPWCLFALFYYASLFTLSTFNK